MIYLDYNATTPVHQSVIDAMLPFLTHHWGNPSSAYDHGKFARRAVEEARQSLASATTSRPEEWIFTSGATESITTAVTSAMAMQPDKPMLLVSAIEHSASWKAAQRACRPENFLVLPVDSSGAYAMDALENILTNHAAKIGLASLMWANNETGGLPGFERVATRLAQEGIAIHTDAVQAMGKVPIDLSSVPVDFLSISGHKFHAPKGIGALFVRAGRRFQAQFLGGGQEFGKRAGTENVPGIVAIGAAARLVTSPDSQQQQIHVAQLRDTLENSLLQNLSGVRPIGAPTNRVANTSCLHIDGVPAADLILLLDSFGICASSGSACSSQSPEPSRALMAHGLTSAEALQTVRFSLGYATHRAEIMQAIEIIQRCVAKIRRLRGTGSPVLQATNMRP